MVLTATKEDEPFSVLLTFTWIPSYLHVSQGPSECRPALRNLQNCSNSLLSHSDNCHERLHHPRGLGQCESWAPLRGQKPKCHPSTFQEIQQGVGVAWDKVGGLPWNRVVLSFEFKELGSLINIQSSRLIIPLLNSFWYLPPTPLGISFGRSDNYP